MRKRCVHTARLCGSARPPALCALIGLAALVAGCSAPKAVRTYEYLADYQRMSDQFEPLVSLVYMPQGARFVDYKTLVIGDVDVGELWVEDREAALGYATRFRTSLANRFSQRRTFEVVSLDPAAEAGPGLPGPLVRMEGKVTVFDLGSGWQRYFSYWFPPFERGASDFQIEARFRDAQSGALVMELADRRRHLGNTPFGPYWKTFKSGFVMSHTVKLTSQCLAEVVDRARNGLSENLGIDAQSELEW